MDFGIASYGLGLAAGFLSTLSPCVLPIIPILLGSATNAHPKAPLVLAGGLAISYALVGTLLASAGATFGFDPSIIRNVGAGLFGVFGLVLISGALQQRFAAATAGIGSAGSNLIANIRFDGLWGQFAIGLVLGVVWSPCVGPTLGAAIVLASQGTHLPQVALAHGHLRGGSRAADRRPSLCVALCDGSPAWSSDCRRARPARCCWADS